MAGYDIPREICPLEKRISDFSVSCGYDPMTVFNDFLTFVIHGFSPGAPPLKNWKYKRRQNIAFMSIVGLSELRNAATPNAMASITTPPRMVFLRPILDATMPTGR